MMENIGNIIVELERNLTIDSLKKSYDTLTKSELDANGSKLLAEICYLLANDYMAKHDASNAKFFAGKSYDIYKQLDISSLEKAVPILDRYLPGIMHEGVVKSRLLSKIES